MSYGGQWCLGGAGPRQSQKAHLRVFKGMRVFVAQPAEQKAFAERFSQEELNPSPLEYGHRTRQTCEIQI